MIAAWFIRTPRTIQQSLFWTILVVASTALLFFKNITYPTNFQFVYHDTAYQLSAAINARLCNTQHEIDPQMVANMRSGGVTDNTRLFALPAFNHVTMQEYCQQHIKDIVTTGYLVKNLDVAEALPLYWLDKICIAIFGNVTLLQLAILFRLLQIGLIGIFSFYLLSLGVRWPTVWVMTFFAIITSVNPFIQALNIHGFVLPCSLAIVAFYGLSMHFGIYRRWYWNIPWLVIIATLELWLFYGRSSQLFALLAINMVYIFFLSKKSQNKYSALLIFLLVKIFTMFSLGYVALVELGPKSITRTHPVIHSIILGLGVPENPIARQEKLTWKDQTGLQVAQRINPLIDTLYTPEYNAALKTYYYSLWKKYPRQMFETYYLKFYFITPNIINNLINYIEQHYEVNLRWFFYPFSLLNGFFALLLLLFAVFYFSHQFVRKLSSELFLLISLFTLVFLNLLENALLSSVFSPRFQNIFLFGFLVLVYVFWIIVIYAGLRLGNKALRIKI